LPFGYLIFRCFDVAAVHGSVTVQVLEAAALIGTICFFFKNHFTGFFLQNTQ
jgi:hypothetical protein